MISKTMQGLVLATSLVLGATQVVQAADGGIHSFADIAKFKDKLDGKIYGIEPGNDGNRLIQDMIDKNAFGLKGFEVVESSEQGMLS